MFDISVLKEMKLSELQEIAKLAKIKATGVKKETLIAQIIERQAAAPEVAEKENTTTAEDNSKSGILLLL